MHLNLAQGLYALPIGLLFGIIYYKTGNIVLTSLLHIVNNGITALQLYTMGENAVDISYAELLGSNFTAYSAMVFFGVLSILFIKWFWEIYDEKWEQTKSCPPKEAIQKLKIFKIRYILLKLIKIHSVDIGVLLECRTFVRVYSPKGGVMPIRYY